MATGPKAGLYQNAQSASYLPLTLVGGLGTKKNDLALHWNTAVSANKPTFSLK